jgi:serine/threonine protein kinase
MPPVAHDASVTVIGRPSSNAQGDGRSALVARLLKEIETGPPSLRVEAILQRFPELQDEPDSILRLILEEVSQRRQRGDRVSFGELHNRFPRLSTRLHSLLGSTVRDALSDLWPMTEEHFGPFKLVESLGHGGGGQVYLAAQQDLGDRLVVLKFVNHEIAEHLTLARLQHTNIVPLFGVYDDPARDRRALCMPYFGSTTLGHVLDSESTTPVERRTGRQVANLLSEREKTVPLAGPGDGPGKRFLAEADHVRSFCWIGACLADALHYAHQRGLLHLDLKPSNVLLAADGQPMLLDFHLARPPLVVGQTPPAYFGGTPTYMSPEQRTACADVLEMRPISAPVDGRADVYSLGMLLFVSLAGGIEPTQAQRTARFLRESNPNVSVGLADIIAKCVAVNPDDRYASAGKLAQDLRNHLDDRPLVGVPNRSWPERWRKWRRRRPYALLFSMLATCLVAAVFFGVLLVGKDVARRQERAEAYLREGDALMLRRLFTPAAQSFARGVEQAEGIGVDDKLRQELDGRLRLARREEKAQELKAIADEIRLLVLSDDVRTPDAIDRTLISIEAHCRHAWDNRQTYLERSEGDDPALARGIRRDLTELVLHWSDVHLRRARPEHRTEAREFVRQLLTQAEELGTSRVVLEWRRDALGENAASPNQEQAFAQARSAFEFYGLGLAYLRAGDPATALEALRRSLVIDAEDYWTHFARGVAAERAGEPDKAAQHFSVCVGLQPAQWIGYFRRGQARAAQGNAKEAIDDFDQALERRPNDTSVLVARGNARLASGDYAKAEADLVQARDQGAAAERVQPSLDRVRRAIKEQEDKR